MNHTAGFHPSGGTVPVHVGIIPDGGRRWAESHGCKLREAYFQTKNTLEVLAGKLFEKGVKEVTVFLSSIQNFKRNADELGAMLFMVESSLSTDIADLAGRLGLRVVIAGNRMILPGPLLAAIVALERSTAGNTRGQLNLLIAYDPLEEIILATRKCGATGRFYNHLQVRTPVDLVIRSGGAQLLSNFLPLQSAYARLYFFDRLINDLTAQDVEEVLEHFSRVKRKFGE
jgi:undecaprenyl diphosphate synthase